MTPECWTWLGSTRLRLHSLPTSPLAASDLTVEKHEGEVGTSVPASSASDESEYPTRFDPADPGRRGRFMMKVYEHTGRKWECHYCKLPLDPNADFGTKHQVTIDHVVPQKIGKYQVIWNCVLCCSRCGKLKGAMSYEMFTGEPTLPEQCWEHFTTTDSAVFAARFKEARHMLVAERDRNQTLR